jgi:hypothetical protein
MMDLRVPSGFFFAILGLIVTALGVLAPGERARLSDVNVNLYSGLTMLAFGIILLILARRAHRRTP